MITRRSLGLITLGVFLVGERVQARTEPMTQLDDDYWFLMRAKAILSPSVYKHEAKDPMRRELSFKAVAPGDEHLIVHSFDPREVKYRYYPMAIADLRADMVGTWQFALQQVLPVPVST
jgi:hypothetical protein